MLDAYFDAFARYLHTGNSDVLAGYCDHRAELDILKVYRNGFFRTCIDVLRSSYPSVVQLVGEKYFTALAHVFVETHPPQAASLATYGEDFPRFIEASRDQHRLDYLETIAVLDRAWSEVYFAGDRERADADRLSAMAADTRAVVDLRCRLAPPVRVVSLEFGAFDAWMHLRQGGIRGRIGIRRATEHVLVWRADDEVACRHLTGAEHTFLARLAAGQSCGKAAGAAAVLDPQFDVAMTFAFLLQERILEFEQ